MLSVEREDSTGIELRRNMKRKKTNFGGEYFSLKRDIFHLYKINTGIFLNQRPLWNAKILNKIPSSKINSNKYAPKKTYYETID